MIKKSIIGVTCTCFLLVVSANTYAVTVGGIINSDTTWVSGTTYDITSTVQVAPGVTLSIEPGATINGQGGGLSTQDIWVYGALSAIGTSSSNIVFNDVNLRGSTSATSIEIQHSQLYNPTPYLYQTDALIITDSLFQNSRYHMAIAGLTSDAYIERNIFDGGHGIEVNSGIVGVDLYIRNNLFVNQDTDEYAVLSQNQHGVAIVHNNSFLSTDRTALKLWSDGVMDASENYWGTTDTSVIDSMIYDRNDNLQVGNYIDYTPILSSPHADTPSIVPVPAAVWLFSSGLIGLIGLARRKTA